jgi:hypothetical protein
LHAAAPAFDGAGSSPEATNEIVAPTMPNWLPAVPLSRTPSAAPPRSETSKRSVAAGAATDAWWTPGNGGPLAVAATGVGTERRMVFAVGARVWEPSPDVSRPYLMWPQLQPDGAGSRLGSDPVSWWSGSEALRARVPLRDATVPYVRYSVPVPVEPGARISSVPPAPEEPLPVRAAEVLGSRQRQP